MCIFNLYIIEGDTDATQDSELLSKLTDSLEKEQILKCMFIIVDVIIIYGFCFKRFR